MKSFMMLVTYFAVQTVWAAPSFIDQANFLCGEIRQAPNFKYEDHFAANFVKKIPYETVIQIFKNIYNDDGPCRSAAIASSTGTSGKVRLFTKSTSQKFLLSIDANGLISGLQFQGRSEPKILISDEKSLNFELSKLSGIKAVYLRNLDSQIPMIDVSSQEKLALGSEFKLYVLKALSEEIAQGIYHWDDKIKIQDSLKSLPSGILQDVAAGTELTIREVASLMISKSDNTGTDHLIDLLGREKIENSMLGFNSFVKLNSPFLTTMDLFRLRTLSVEEVDSYLNQDRPKKLDFLSDLAKKFDRKQLTEKLSDWNSPRDIRKIEWFASPKDICNTIANLKDQAQNDKTIFDILSLSNPFIWTEDDPHFEYVGYKGGSEPGVLTMTFLLKSRNQKWACLSMGINNESSSLDENSVADLFHAILNYSGIRLEK